MSVRIITDSGSDILSGEHEGLVVLPLSIMFGTTTYADGVDLSHERFYELLVEEDDLPKTGQVNPFAFSQAFEEAYEAGDEVVCITLSSKLSGTYQSALTAASEAKVVVRVVDSLNVCVGERILVEYALRLAAAGKSAAEIAEELERVRGNVCVVALLDTLEYLKRGGRISSAAAGVGALLSAAPRTAATFCPSRSRRPAASISRCPWRSAMRVSRTSCCASTSRTRRPSGSPASPTVSCPFTPSVPPSALTWAPAPSRLRSSRRSPAAEISS